MDTLIENIDNINKEIKYAVAFIDTLNKDEILQILFNIQKNIDEIEEEIDIETNE